MGWTKVDPIAVPLTRRIDAAALRAIDNTTAAAAIYAKQHHPGWQNRTGAAEGSVRHEPASKVGPNHYRGLFGSFDVFYVIFLELLHGHFLRNAADAEFPKLGANLRKELS